jgi:hypothetical protein
MRNRKMVGNFSKMSPTTRVSSAITVLLTHLSLLRASLAEQSEYMSSELLSSNQPDKLGLVSHHGDLAFFQKHLAPSTCRPDAIRSLRHERLLVSRLGFSQSRRPLNFFSEMNTQTTYQSSCQRKLAMEMS